MQTRRSWSIAGRVFGIQMGAVLGALGLLVTALSIEAQWNAEGEARDRSLAVCRMLASTPEVVDAFADADPTASLQPRARSAMAASGVDFITIMTTDGVRLTHPNPDQIGKQFLGTITAAQRGETLVETFTGTLGPSVRAVVPIFDNDETLVGIVSAGVTTRQISDAVLPRLPLILVLACVIVAIGTAAAALSRRVVRRVAGDLAPQRLRGMVSFYESVLHSVREGVVITDERGDVVLYNDEAADLLGLPPSPGGGVEPTPAADLGVSPDLARMLASGTRAVEEIHAGADRVLLVNQEPMTPSGSLRGGNGAPGAVMTLRDHSALTALSGELDSVRTMSEALRSQTHEHSNLLHTIVGLLEAGEVEEAVNIIEESSQASQKLTDRIAGARREPALSALLLGKAATANEWGVAFAVSLDQDLPLPLTPTELVSVVGNLVDNALEAVRGLPDAAVTVEGRAAGSDIVIAVRDTGRGPSDDRVFERGVTTKSGPHRGIGLALVRSIVEGRGGRIEFLPGDGSHVEVRLPRDEAR
ncbi:two-component system CitB family sensor kinase [Microbacterium sp. SORGH_AS 1204]|uniref:sensor histidine kinase n=1 Tax=Microbacterium sp. SORGH_AS_1204 TaxID=3041785 RepID=UPI0027934746|nr:sensor histidine kinase [Microbacterium sp. SORGH_AS_1204]MDQ1138026.1 two-component system CitB family sensor kinase [Microbacterium sp. SORGH_AS_1204]